VLLLKEQYVTYTETPKMITETPSQRFTEMTPLTSTHLRPATEKRKEEGYGVTTTYLSHNCTILWMCFPHWTLLALQNSQALTACPSTQRETPTTGAFPSTVT